MNLIMVITFLVAPFAVDQYDGITFVDFLIANSTSTITTCNSFGFILL